MFSYLLYRFGQFLALSLPLKKAYKLAIFLSDLQYYLAFRDRKRVAENLKIIFPDKSKSEITKIQIQTFRNFAKYLVDFFRFDKLNMEYINKNINIVNIDYINEGLKAGKGVILLTGHLGNWELGGVMLSMIGYPLTSVALPHKSKRVNSFFNRQRESKGVKIFPLGNAAKSCLKVLKQNGIIGLVGDRDFTGKGIIIDFFGKEAIFPLGAAALSLKTGAQIIPGFMLRNNDDSFSIVLEKPIQYEITGNDHKDLRQIAIKYKDIFESYIKNYPEQWYMFRRFWKT